MNLPLRRPAGIGTLRIMKYRLLPRTDLTLSEIGFPVWAVVNPYWGVAKELDAVRLIQKAFASGITFFDTIDVLDEGEEERTLAEALGKHRHEVVIGAKVGYDWYTPPHLRPKGELVRKWTPEFLAKACDATLLRLRTDFIDLFQLYHPDMRALEQDALFGALDDLRRKGKIRASGVVLGPGIGWEREGETAMKERNVQSLQAVYNIFEQTPARDFLSLAKETRTGFIVREPHAAGLLDGRYNDSLVLPPGSATAFGTKEWYLLNRRKIEALSFLRPRYEITLGQASLRFVLANPQVVSSLAVMTTTQSVESYAAVSELTDLDETDVKTLRDMYDDGFGLKKDPVRQEA